MPTKLSRYCEGLMEAAWLAAIILTPVFFDTYSARIFEPDKITLLRSLALLILGAWLVKLVEEGGVRWERLPGEEARRKAFLRTPMVVPVLALIVVYLISTVFSIVPRASLLGSYQRLQGTYTTFSYLIIFGALLANLRRRTQVERLVTTVIIASLPISLYGILQRYHIDPIPWGGDVSTRIAANMGNSIFVSAYLIMAFPLTILRVWQSFNGILHDDDRRSVMAQTVRGAFYVFIAAVQIIAQYMSQSRGPALGLVASLFLMALLLSLHSQRRLLTYAVVGAGVLGVVGLLLFNIQGGPLEALRDSPAIGRYGQLLNEDSTNAKVRVYIWQGVAQLVGFHSPLQYPDGSQDAFNVIRPLIGYGPESLYYAYNRFYVPALGTVEKRNASPDRSHNETWDSLATTGVLGFLVYLLVYASVFYYALKWIGLINNPRQRNLFIGLYTAGGLVGAVALVVWRGIEYLGVGVPFGILFGLLAYVILVALSGGYQAPSTSGESLRSLTLIVLLGAILAHFVEINFGIAIAVTNTYFWVYTALIVLVGYVLPLHNQYELTPAQATSLPHVETSLKSSSRSETGQEAARSARRARRKAEAGGGRYAAKYSPLFGDHPWLQTALISAFIILVVLMALGYDYLQNPDKSTSAFGVLGQSFTQLPNHNNAVSFGILFLIGLTWTASTAIWVTDQVVETHSFPWLPAGLSILGASALVTFIFYLWQAGELVAVANMVPTTVTEAIGQIDQVGSVLSNFYVFLFIILFGAAFIFPLDWPTRSFNLSPAGGVTAVAAVFLFIFLTSYTNIRIIRADIAFKMADPYNTSGQWPVATMIYKHANQLAPSEDYYYLFLGRSYLEQAKESQTDAEKASLVKQAETDLKTAQRLNPLNTDHTANLARLYAWWSGQASNSQDRLQRGQIASDYYASALTLSPQNSTLWGEWAVLFMDDLNQPQQAYQRLQHALELDPTYNWTEGLMGDYYARQGRLITDTVQRSQDMLQSVKYYTEALKWTAKSDITSQMTYWVGLGNAYMDMKQYDQAITAFENVVSLGPGSETLYRIDETLALLFAQKGDKANAVQFAQEALNAAPQTEKDRLTQLVEKYQALP